MDGPLAIVVRLSESACVFMYMMKRTKGRKEVQLCIVIIDWKKERKKMGKRKKGP